MAALGEERMQEWDRRCEARTSRGHQGAPPELKEEEVEERWEEALWTLKSTGYEMTFFLEQRRSVGGKWEPELGECI